MNDFEYIEELKKKFFGLLPEIEQLIGVGDTGNKPEYVILLENKPLEKKKKRVYLAVWNIIESSGEFYIFARTGKYTRGKRVKLHAFIRSPLETFELSYHKIIGISFVERHPVIVIECEEYYFLCFTTCRYKLEQFQIGETVNVFDAQYSNYLGRGTIIDSVNCTVVQYREENGVVYVYENSQEKHYADLVLDLQNVYKIRMIDGTIVYEPQVFITSDSISN